MKIKKVLYIFLPIMIVLLGVGKCSYNTYAGVEEAKTAKAMYEGYIQKVISISNASSNVLEFSNNIRILEAPGNLIYFGITKNDNEQLDIIKKYSGNSTSLTKQYDIGFGTVDGIDIFVFEFNLNNLTGVSKCILYIKR